MSTLVKGVKMSKIKDELERILEIELEHYVSFMEWVCDQQSEVSDNDVNGVEEDSKKPSTLRTSIIHQKAFNNPDYNPKIGA